MRQVKFYQIDRFDTADLAKFKVMDLSVLDSVSTILKTMRPSSSVEDKRSNMLISNSESFSSFEGVLESIQAIWQKDYSENVARAAEEKWEFCYLLPKPNVAVEMFLIIANLYYAPSENEGNVLYNLVAVKKDGTSYFLWDMTS